MRLFVWLLSTAGITQPEGPLTVAPVREGDVLTAKRDGAGWHIDGTATRVPWARQCGAIAVLAESGGKGMDGKGLANGNIPPA